MKKIINFLIMMQISISMILVTPGLFANENLVEETTGNDVGWYTSVCVDSQDNFHISYYDYGKGDLKYALKTQGSWNIQIVESTGDVGRYTSLALDSTQHPHISYYDHSNKDLKYAQKTDTSWVITTIDQLGNVGLFTSLYLDKNDDPHISYVDYDNHLLKYAHKENDEWIIETVDSNVGMGEYFGDTTSIVTDANNRPHISYTDRAAFDLKYAFHNGQNWIKTTVDDENQVGQYSSITLDSDDNPHISYASWSDTSLKYASLEEETWTIEPIDESGDVRKWTSIKLDNEDKPHISYYDYTLGSLQYITSDGIGWQKETIDHHGSTGCFNCICLNSENQIGISYYDWGKKALKFVSSETDWMIETIEKDPYYEFIDQQMNYCSGYSYPINEGTPIAQSFVPSTDLLTMIEIMLVKRYNPGEFTIAIKETLEGKDLVSQTYSSEEINEDLSWKMIDFPDINVTIGQPYYIVCSAENTNGNNMYYWYFGHNDPYINGRSWMYTSMWAYLNIPGFSNPDFGFKTYGFINDVPSIPTITGPSSGKIDVEQSYHLKAEDANNDDIYFDIQWSTSDQERIGPFPSGEQVSVNHSWQEEGEYTIKVKSVDEHGAESNWVSFSVTMPKKKGIDPFINEFITKIIQIFEERFPLFFQLFFI